MFRFVLIWVSQLLKICLSDWLSDLIIFSAGTKISGFKIISHGSDWSSELPISEDT